MKMKKKADEPKRPGFVSKPWGYELIAANSDKYCLKKLIIAKGQSTSLHCHKTKDETFFVQRGKSVVYYCDDRKSIPPALQDGLPNPEVYRVLREIKLSEGDVFHVPPGRVHKIFALEDLELIEGSTKHVEDDTIRFYTNRRS